MAGEIVEVGQGVRLFDIGDRVFASHHVSCNTCHFCLHGHHTACETLHTTNYDPGGFAEFVRVPPLQVDRGTFALPADMSYDVGTFIEPVGCVVRGLRGLAMPPGSSVLVLGSGISGLLVIALARAFAAGRVFATDINPKRLEIAGEFGAFAAIPAEEDVPAAVREANRGALADFVIVCTGAAEAAEQALASVERGGTVLFFAVPRADISVPISDFWRNDIALRTTYGAAPQDLAEALALLEAGHVPAERMITHRLGLADTQQGFQMVAQGEDSLKVIVHPQE
jgi:L-iditol 2-dehydrogenase